MGTAAGRSQGAYKRQQKPGQLESRHDHQRGAGQAGAPGDEGCAVSRAASDTSGPEDRLRSA